jgi:formylglycine-generating enzyme required for sulfatase activity
MANQELNKAIQLIQSGDPAAAVPILSQLVFVNPHDESAWDWLIKALPPDQRLRAAEMFCKQNPKSALARHALEALTPPPPPPLNPVLVAVKVPLPPRPVTAEKPPEPAPVAERVEAKVSPEPAEGEDKPETTDDRLEVPPPADPEAVPAETGQTSASESTPGELPANKERLKRWQVPIGILVFAAGFSLGIFGMLYQGRYFTRSAVLAAETSQARARLIVASVSAVPTVIPSPTAINTPTLPPSPTLAPTSQSTAVPTPAAGDSQLSEVDGAPMVFIPAGTFTMGWNGGEASERPEHQVNLDAYWVDVREVTNAMYALCVRSGKCTPPAKLSSYKQANYYNNPEYEPYPVIYVTWLQASTYCRWAGRRLPSEAEWEKAARGEADTRKYPWGDQAPTDDLANYGYLDHDTIPSGVLIKGASPFGVLDMAGNVFEWVNDLYTADYYRNSPADNPPGPVSGNGHVYRGGSFGSSAYEIRLSRRGHGTESYNSFGLGFRCALSTKPEATIASGHATNTPTQTTPSPASSATITATP